MRISFFTIQPETPIVVSAFENRKLTKVMKTTKKVLFSDRQVLFSAPDKISFREREFVCTVDKNLVENFL